MGITNTVTEDSSTNQLETPSGSSPTMDRFAPNSTPSGSLPSLLAEYPPEIVIGDDVPEPDDIELVELEKPPEEKLEEDDFIDQWKTQWKDEPPTTVPSKSPGDVSSKPTSKEGEKLPEEEKQQLILEAKRQNENALKKLIKQKLGDAYEVIEYYCNGWEYSLPEIAAFILYLGAFNESKQIRMMAFYDERLLELGYYHAQFAAAAYRGPNMRRVHKRIPFLPKTDFIKGNWNKLELTNAPAWFICLDSDKKNVVLSLRGTKERNELLVDLTCGQAPFLEGFAHKGFLASAKTLIPLVKPELEKQLQLHPDYSLLIIGHSMGAAIATILTLTWAREHPTWHVRGVGFATPCVISAHLVEYSKQYFTTWVHHFDAITRLSMGSLDDIRVGMRLFCEQLGKPINAIEVFVTSLAKLARIRIGQKMLKLAGSIDAQIQKNLLTEVSELKVSKRLYPAGNTYQFWRESRGGQFTTWEAFKSSPIYYGRLQMSPSMLRDHGTAAYLGAFENLLALTVVESSLWWRISISRRTALRAYWESDPDVLLYAKDFDVRPLVKRMSRPSSWKSKAFERGVIRPFLLLVSMSPKRRAALAKLTGINLLTKAWYTEFDPHHEAWYILGSRSHGLQTRANSAARTINPLANNSDWYQILYECQLKLRKTQKKYIPDHVKALLVNKKRSFHKTIESCKSKTDKKLPYFEEVVYLLITSLVKAKAAEIPIEYNQDELFAINSRFCQLGFSVEEFLDLATKQVLDGSSFKKANELYAWSDIVRREDERLKKRTVATVVGLAFLSLVCLTAIGPFAILTPPMAVVPLFAGIGMGVLAVSKSRPAGLVSVVVGCLQQRLALGLHGVRIEDYYPRQIIIKRI